MPLLVTALCFAIFLPPDAALPWTRVERVHRARDLDYAVQHLAFRRAAFRRAVALSRAGRVEPDRARTRRLDRLFALGVGGVLVFVADMLAGSVAYQSRWLDALARHGSPRIRNRSARAPPSALSPRPPLCCHGTTRAAAVSLPRILYILGLAAMVAVALQPRSLFLFLAIWTSQHWILAVGPDVAHAGDRTRAGAGPLRVHSMR